MPATAAATASPARILANQTNALRSTGPKTAEGKERSRANALKHGLTGGGVVLTVEDAAEVDRMMAGVEVELAPSGPIEHALARRVATSIVRMDRCVAQETAAVSERVRKALDEFEAPEGTPAADVDRLRAEAAALAMFDPSQEASLARKYEAAAERGLYRALKEIRQIRRDSAKPAEAGRSVVQEAAKETRASLDRLGSFFQAEPAPRPGLARTANPAPKPAVMANLPLDLATMGVSEVPISIGRAR